MLRVQSETVLGFSVENSRGNSFPVLSLLLSCSEPQVQIIPQTTLKCDACRLKTYREHCASCLLLFFSQFSTLGSIIDASYTTQVGLV